MSGSAADGFATQVQPPGRERVAEQFACDLVEMDDGDQNGSGEPEIACGFQRDDIVSGPPITDADNALMPMIA